MAHKKAGGSSRNGRDSQSKRRNGGMGTDHSLCAVAAGQVEFREGKGGRTFVSVVKGAAEKG